MDCIYQGYNLIMHSYLRAIGFGGPDCNKNIRYLLDKIIEKDETVNKAVKKEGESVEIFKHFSANMGISFHGEFLSDNSFNCDFYYPFAVPMKYMQYDEINIEKNVMNMSFYASCEDNRLGFSVIFFVQNGLDYINFDNNRGISKLSAKVGFVAMSLSGKILMPIKKDSSYNSVSNELRRYRGEVLKEARKGNQEAIDAMAIDEMNEYNQICKRMVNEDILSIVDTSIMPYGIECDKYQIIGEIKDIVEDKNGISDEEILEMLLDCNDISLTLLINKKDLLGIPKIGRRFKGVVWLQGKIDFNYSELD